MLMAKGFKLLSSVRDPQSQRVYFSFDDNETIEGMDARQLQSEYFSGRAMVPALKYSEAVKGLKSLCHICM
jgi:hypothetical protein